MIDDDVREQLKNLDGRLARVEQFLPSVATKSDLTAQQRELEAAIATLAAKADLERFATKDDLERYATKADLEGFATKADLERFATKADLERFATEADLERFATKAEVREEGERTRHHMDVVAEHLLDRIGLLYEGHARQTERLDGHDSRLDALDARHDGLDRRVRVLEGGGPKGKK